MKIVTAGTVIDDESAERRGCCFRALECGTQPLAAVFFLRQVYTPTLVDYRLNDNRRMIPVSLDHLMESSFAALAGLLCKVIEVVPRRHLVPDEHAHLIGSTQVGGIANLDVTAQ